MGDGVTSGEAVAVPSRISVSGTPVNEHPERQTACVCVHLQSHTVESSNTHDTLTYLPEPKPDVDVA